MELLSFPKITDSEVQQIAAFISVCRVVPIDESIKNKAIAIRRATGIKLPDSIIAAVAAITGETLVKADQRLSTVGVNCMLYTR